MGRRFLAFPAILLLAACSAPTQPRAATAPAAVESTPAPAVVAEATPTPTPTPLHETLPQPLRSGSTGMLVRELQARLGHVKCYPYYDVDDTFGPRTLAAVQMFQERNALPVTGIVDDTMWNLLINASPKPSAAALANAEPGKVYVRHDVPGLVKELQHRMRQLSLYDGAVDGTFTAPLASAVETFQQAHGLPVTGEVDRRTWDRLSGFTRNPTVAETNAKPLPPQPMKADPRCLKGARAFCVSLSEGLATYYENGVAVTTFEGRPGMPGHETPRGTFAIEQKNWQTVSTMFGEAFPMPYAMFWNESRAFHFSFDFLDEGRNGGSHGCINMRDYDTMKWLYDRAKIGDPVYIYD